MNTKSKILIVEHDATDLELLKYELVKAEINYVSEVVQTEKDYYNALKNFVPDIILSDFSFPSFDGPTAFEMRQQMAPDTPFIFVSGYIGEEKSIEFIKNGVTDYAVKDKLFTLTTKIKRALEEAKEKKQKQKSEQELVQSERRLRRAQQIAQMGSWELNFKTNVLVWSDEACRIYGLPPGQNPQTFQNWMSFIHPDDLDFVLKEIKESYGSLRNFSFFHRIVQKNGDVRHIYSESRQEYDVTGVPTVLYGIAQDVTTMKQAEEKMEFDSNNLTSLINNTSDAMWSVDRQFKFITYNLAFTELIKRVGAQPVIKGDNALLTEFNKEKLSGYQDYYKRAFEGETFTIVEYSKAPEEFWTEISFSPIRKGEDVIGTACTLRDITKRKKEEVGRLLSEKRLNEAQKLAHLGNWELNFLTSEAIWSDETCRIFGLTIQENKHSFESWMSFTHPDDAEYLLQKIKDARDTLSDSHVNYRIVLRDKSVKHVYSESKIEFDINKNPVRFYGIIQDMTDRKQAESERVKMMVELTQRNKDLEQFAYIVSHNLRAPVANIIGAASGLNSPDLSIEEKTILNKGISDSVTRLDNVIKDLNRVLEVKGDSDERKEMVYFSKLVDEIKSSLESIITSENITIDYDFSSMEGLVTLKSYMYSIFYNLIHNSIKYRQQHIPPIISIKSYIVANNIVLLFTDNGLGIDLQKRGDQVFGLYKRFHLHIEGKGMGLFMVKTQVETLGGRINIESEVNKGTEFTIEFPR